MNYKDLADLIFPDSKEISYYEEKYPERNLKEGAVVTRFAPSPTGVMHIGGLYQALVAIQVSKKTEGVFFLRVEPAVRPPGKQRHRPGRTAPHRSLQSSHQGWLEKRRTRTAGRGERSHEPGRSSDA